MRASDRQRLDARLAALETRQHATSGARERLAASLDGIAARVAPLPPEEALARLVAGLASAGDSLGIAALRRVVALHG